MILDGLTLSNGSSYNEGGSIDNMGTLIISRCTFLDNFSAPDHGGSIYNHSNANSSVDNTTTFNDTNGLVAMMDDVCDGNTAGCDGVKEICDAGGFKITMTLFTPANENKGVAEFTYKICRDPGCEIVPFRDLSHFNVFFPKLGGDSCLNENTMVSGTCSCVVNSSGTCSVQSNAVLGDGSCHSANSPLLKCDNTTLGEGDCIELTMAIPDPEGKLSLGTTTVVSKAATNCHESCIAGPSCDDCPCTQDADCDDGNPCTTGTCDSTSGECVYTDKTGPCDDGDLCTSGEFCSGGFCSGGTPLNCDDGNPCTIDTCDESNGECLHEEDPSCRSGDDDNGGGGGGGSVGDENGLGGGAVIPADNCPGYDNPDQFDLDLDGWGDLCDNCPEHYNPLQEDIDNDLIGDICDNCPEHSNPFQEDDNKNGIGNICESFVLSRGPDGEEKSVANITRKQVLGKSPSCSSKNGAPGFIELLLLALALVGLRVARKKVLIDRN